MSKHQRTPGSAVGLSVDVRHNDVPRALQKLKKMLLEDGVIQELRQREFYESKGTKKRMAKKAAIRRYKKNQLKNNEV